MFEWPWKKTGQVGLAPEEDVSRLMAAQTITLADRDAASGWALYEDVDTGAVVQACQRELPGLFCAEGGDVEMFAGDYVVSPPGAGRRVIRQSAFEARFRRKEGG